MMCRFPNEVREEFLAVHFSIKFSPSPFRALWTDMNVERSVIKDTKSNSGIIGFTRKDSTVLRWTTMQNTLGVYSSTMQARSGCNNAYTMYEEFEHEGVR